MKPYRFSIAVLMGSVAAVAIDFSVIRAFDANSADAIPHFMFATGVMPVASLLILVGVISTPQLLRSGELSSFFIGFESLGWTAVFAFVACYSISTKSVMSVAEAIAAICRLSTIAYLQNLPGWAGIFVELGFATILFSLPQLLIALLGAWFSRRCGLGARFFLVNSAPHGTPIPHHTAIPVRSSQPGE